MRGSRIVWARQLGRAVQVGRVTRPALAAATPNHDGCQSATTDPSRNNIGMPAAERTEMDDDDGTARHAFQSSRNGGRQLEGRGNTSCPTSHARESPRALRRNSSCRCRYTAGWNTVRIDVDGIYDGLMEKVDWPTVTVSHSTQVKHEQSPCVCLSAYNSALINTLNDS